MSTSEPLTGPKTSARSDAVEAPCELLDWDTDFWGVRVARVRGDKLDEHKRERIDAWCHEQGVECLYFLASADDPTTTAIAEDCGFRFVGIRLTVGIALTDFDPERVILSPAGLSIREAEPDDLDALRAIARSSYRTTRFYRDPGFPDARCDDLYERWLMNMYEDSTSIVFAAILNEEPVGHATLGKLRARHFPLMALREDARGRGVGEALVMRRLRWLHENEHDHTRFLTFPPGNNVAALRVYERCGMSTEQVQLWYHKWYRAP